MTPEEKREDRRIYAREYRKANPAKIKADSQAYRLQNAEKIREAAKESYALDPEKRLRSGKVWRDANPHKVNAKKARRRAFEIKATPRWADPEKIVQIYGDARYLSELTGAVIHVDHIIPLLSKLVCGLHCEANLQVTTDKDNTTKGNRYWPDMP